MVALQSNVTAADAIQDAAAASQAVGLGYAEVDPADGEHLITGDLRRYLAELRLLHQIPFSYLVPDSTLLPLESMRFFYLDRNWTDAVVQGVLSVGTVTTTDRSQLEAAYPLLRNEVDETERMIRTGVRPADCRTPEARSPALSSDLGRSPAGQTSTFVRTQKDSLEDEALTGTAESHVDRMKILRMERLAPAVLLVLIDGVPEVVHIEEPRQGIQFGARTDPEDPPDERRAKVKLRNPGTGEPIEPIDDFTPDNSVDVPFRSSAPGSSTSLN